MRIDNIQTNDYLSLTQIYSPPNNSNTYSITFRSFPMQITLTNNNYTFPEAPFAKFFITKLNFSRIIVGKTSISSISYEFNSSSNITKILASTLPSNSLSITNLEASLMGEWAYVSSSANNLGCNAFFDPVSKILRFYKLENS